MGQRSGPATLQAQGLLGGGIAAPVAVTNFPNSQNVVVTNTPLPISFKQNLVSDGVSFSLVQPGTSTGIPTQPKLFVPAGVVVTDVHATVTGIFPVSNGGFLLVSDRSKVYMHQAVNTTTFDAGADLHSGIVSDGTLVVSFTCQNSTNNQCIGALMYSGYQQ
jgi:hypothetical protein